MPRVKLEKVKPFRAKGPWQGQQQGPGSLRPRAGSEEPVITRIQDVSSEHERLPLSSGLAAVPGVIVNSRYKALDSFPDGPNHHPRLQRA